MEHLTQRSCEDFAELLAAKAPVPGGGGAAALAGALGAALCSMVGNYTAGKRKYAGVEADINAVLAKAEALRLRLLELVDEDAEAFAPLAEAYAVPKGDPARGGALESAALGACAAPLEIAELCGKALGLLEEMLGKGSAMLVSDVGCGALLCRAALESAAMNVYVNTRLLADRERAAELEAGVDRLAAASAHRAGEIVRSVAGRLRRGAADILRGAPAAAALSEALAPRVRAMWERGGTVPTLAILRVGDPPDGAAYENSILKRCAKVGVEVRRYLIPEEQAGARLPDAIREINEDPAVHGCLLLRPLADRAAELEAQTLLRPEKDVDGMTPLSLSAVFTGRGPGYPPCTARACLELLDYYRVPLRGRRAVVVGRSLVAGRPLAMLLQARDATVTLCHSKTEDLAAVCREADVLIAAAGRAGLVGRACFRPGQVVVDVGTSVDGEGKLRGDVRFEEAEPVVSAVTPVPGGVGAVTTAVLCAHVVEAAERALSLYSQRG